ncbi:MAG: bifunctional glutamate N-acetyltransferase/amino-acid acetyltransferase ArgJ [Armatimonadetes bacterium]|nr:bifunctional glutamate N-acetyltransferase/amino-acid acetyltransferase ArgJ [Armatimonadota bacterium]
MRRLDGAVTAPKGFKAAGIRCGIKQQGPDLALIFSEVPAACAGMFTTNAVKAAPVLVSTERVRSGCAQAVIANSGNANACTGKRGLEDALSMAEFAARALGLDAEEVLVCSTGIIGQFLPMDKIEFGIAEAAAALSPQGGPDAARAIMTTDTRPKTAAYEFEIDGAPVRVGGIAKGSGMIAPNLATMFCFLTTDAAIEPYILQDSLAQAVEASFNSLTVDGDMSTNDTVIALANHIAGNRLIDSPGPALDMFQSALETVTVELARELARDAEGATKLVEVVVKNAASYSDARSAAMTIANSLLVKTAIFGEDPNWGRVLAAAGRSEAALDPTRVDLSFGDVKIVENGSPLDVSSEEARRPMLEPEMVITLDLKLGESSARVFTCDISYDYVKINAEYHT